jgi:hypothetical protein
MNQIATDLARDGAYTSSHSVEQIAHERDRMVGLLRAFLRHPTAGAPDVRAEAQEMIDAHEEELRPMREALARAAREQRQ